MYWKIRDELSLSERLRRSYYELLRDEINQFLLERALTQSYQQFAARKTPYPFVERRELKPRARIPKVEYECQNSFLVIFMEDIIPPEHKKYIRFFDSNRTTKTNLLKSKTLPMDSGFDRTQKYLDSAHFMDVFDELLPVDYALLIQRDPSRQPGGQDRYGITHFHVRIDWPITEAAEDMARDLRYISKDLYEKGEKYAEDVQRKFFEYYCLPEMVGGRRTAGVVAAQYLKRVPCISTIYVASSESRALIRSTEHGVSKSVLIKLTDKEMLHIAESRNMPVSRLKKHYMIVGEGKSGVFIFKANYARTTHAQPPESGKLRELVSEPYWLTVASQQILPRIGAWDWAPIHCNLIYA
ncbi:MAG: hypothetical protein C4518_20220 [Desulfobacteraceae bacterium]|nr:MAG: hypothetical protein C4518_20220 [Desulfobacteraceae bacterium]